MKSSKALSPVVAMILLMGVTVALSITTAVWMSSLTSFYHSEEVKIVGLHFHDETTALFPDLPNVTISGTKKDVVVEEPSNIYVSGTTNNVTVVGDGHNIWLTGGDNNLTLVSPGKIFIDISNPDISVTQISGGGSSLAILMVNLL